MLLSKKKKEKKSLKTLENLFEMAFFSQTKGAEIF